MLRTVTRARRFIPNKLLIPKRKKVQPPSPKRNIHSSVFGFTDNVTLCSYVPKPRRCVVILSTKPYSEEVTDAAQQPVLITDYYNKPKGGLDTINKMN